MVEMFPAEGGRRRVDGSRVEGLDAAVESLQSTAISGAEAEVNPGAPMPFAEAGVIPADAEGLSSGGAFRLPTRGDCFSQAISVALPFALEADTAEAAAFSEAAAF